MKDGYNAFQLKELKDEPLLRTFIDDTMLRKHLVIVRTR
jgi:hypothetical protein